MKEILLVTSLEIHDGSCFVYFFFEFVISMCYCYNLCPTFIFWSSVVVICWDSFRVDFSLCVFVVLGEELIFSWALPVESPGWGSTLYKCFAFASLEAPLAWGQLLLISQFGASWDHADSLKSNLRSTCE